MQSVSVEKETKKSVCTLRPDKNTEKFRFDCKKHTASCQKRSNPSRERNHPLTSFGSIVLQNFAQKHESRKKKKHFVLLKKSFSQSQSPQSNLSRNLKSFSLGPYRIELLLADAWQNLGSCNLSKQVPFAVRRHILSFHRWNPKDTSLSFKNCCSECENFRYQSQSQLP